MSERRDIDIFSLLILILSIITIVFLWKRGWGDSQYNFVFFKTKKYLISFFSN